MARAGTRAAAGALSSLILDSLGCVLAEDVTADRDEPPFDKALVDGYAVRAADLAAADGRLAWRDDPRRPDPDSFRLDRARRPRS